MEHVFQGVPCPAMTGIHVPTTHAQKVGPANTRRMQVFVTTGTIVQRVIAAMPAFVPEVVSRTAMTMKRAPQTFARPALDASTLSMLFLVPMAPPAPSTTSVQMGYVPEAGRLHVVMETHAPLMAVLQTPVVATATTWRRVTMATLVPQVPPAPVANVWAQGPLIVMMKTHAPLTAVMHPVAVPIHQTLSTVMMATPVRLGINVMMAHA